MWHYHRSWKAGAEALITTGAISLLFGILSFPELFKEDFLSVVILLLIGAICIAAGIWIKRWARKNGKK